MFICCWLIVFFIVQKFKKEEADAEEVKKGMRLKDRNIKGAVTKPAVKVPRKNTKKAVSDDKGKIENYDFDY